MNEAIEILMKCQTEMNRIDIKQCEQEKQIVRLTTVCQDLARVVIDQQETIKKLTNAIGSNL